MHAGAVFFAPRQFTRKPIQAGNNSDGDLDVAGADRPHQRVVPVAKTALDLARREQGLHGMIVAPHREIEDREHGVADGLVEDAVIAPDRGGAVVVERVEQRGQPVLRDGLRQLGVAAQIGEQDGGVDGHGARLHDFREGHLADRACVRVHAARPDAEQTKRRRQGAAQRDRHMQVLPAAKADRCRFRRHRRITCCSSNEPGAPWHAGSWASPIEIAALRRSPRKLTPIRVFLLQITWHSYTTEASRAITRRNLCGTKAGFSTSMAAPSGEMFTIVQCMTEPPDET
ncbi:hypothetical protein AB7M46_008590 [Bradyrhizobium elkanii]